MSDLNGRFEGVGAKDRAQKFLEKNEDNFNYSEKACPFTHIQCMGSQCMSWKLAKVSLSNPGRMEERHSIYEIKLGRCINPMVTGEVKILK